MAMKIFELLNHVKSIVIRAAVHENSIGSYASRNEFQKYKFICVRTNYYQLS